MEGKDNAHMITLVCWLPSGAFCGGRRFTIILLVIPRLAVNDDLHPGFSAEVQGYCFSL